MGARGTGRHVAEQTEHERWQSRVRTLRALLRAAEAEVGTTSVTLVGLSLRAGERVYVEVDGGLVELRNRGRRASWRAVQAGTVTVTSQRIVFSGRTRREWAYDALTEVVHASPCRTVLAVTDRPTASGVDYDGATAERTRVLIDVAIADSRGRRADVVRDLRDRLADHVRREPRDDGPVSRNLMTEPSSVCNGRHVHG